MHVADMDLHRRPWQAGEAHRPGRPLGARRGSARQPAPRRFPPASRRADGRRSAGRHAKVAGRPLTVNDLFTAEARCCVPRTAPLPSPSTTRQDTDAEVIFQGFRGTRHDLSCSHSGRECARRRTRLGGSPIHGEVRRDGAATPRPLQGSGEPGWASRGVAMRQAVASDPCSCNQDRRSRVLHGRDLHRLGSGSSHRRGNAALPPARHALSPTDRLGARGNLRVTVCSAWLGARA